MAQPINSNYHKYYELKKSKFNQELMYAKYTPFFDRSTKLWVKIGYIAMTLLIYPVIAVYSSIAVINHSIQYIRLAVAKRRLIKFTNLFQGVYRAQVFTYGDNKLKNAGQHLIKSQENIVELILYFRSYSFALRQNIILGHKISDEISNIIEIFPKVGFVDSYTSPSSLLRYNKKWKNFEWDKIITLDFEKTLENLTTHYQQDLANSHSVDENLNIKDNYYLNKEIVERFISCQRRIHLWSNLINELKNENLNQRAESINKIAEFSFVKYSILQQKSKQKIKEYLIKMIPGGFFYYFFYKIRNDKKTFNGDKSHIKSHSTLNKYTDSVQAYNDLISKNNFLIPLYLSNYRNNISGRYIKALAI